MRQITQYQAIDGTIFADEKSCEEYEATLLLIKKAMKPLGDSGQLINRHGWIQHKKENYDKAKIALLNLCRPICKNFPDIIKMIDSNRLEIHPTSFISRLLDDSNSPCKWAMGRLSCIDEKYREYSQPYFAINGPENDMVCVEDRSK